MWVVTNVKGYTTAVDAGEVVKLFYEKGTNSTFAITKHGNRFKMCDGDEVKRIVKEASLNLSVIDLTASDGENNALL